MKSQVHQYFNKNNPKLLLLNIAYVLFLFAFIFKLVNILLVTDWNNTYSFSDSFINYQGGFIRRGLMGEILYFFAVHFNFNVEWTVKILALICFSALCIFFVRFFIKKGYTLYILPLCFFLGAPVLNNESLIRKDSLMMCFFIGIFFIFNKNNFSKIVKVLIINILAIIIIFIHETFVFFSFPLLLILFWNLYREKGYLKSIVLSVISLLPGIMAFILMMSMQGTMETAQTIWDSWLGIIYKEPSNVRWDTALGAIGWETIPTIKSHLIQNFMAIKSNISSLVVHCFVFPVIYYIATNALLVFRKNEKDFTNKDKKVLSSIFIFQLISLLPLFTLLSCDYARLIFYWTTSSFAVFLLVPANEIESLIPKFFARFIDFINNNITVILRPTKTTLVFLMMFIGISPYSLFIDKVVSSTMIYNVLFTLSAPMVILKKLFFYFI